MSLFVCFNNNVYTSIILYFLVDCGEPEVPLNGTVQVDGNNLEGSVATYSCDAGHLLIGDTQRMCTSNDSIWSGAVPECQCT